MQTKDSTQSDPFTIWCRDEVFTPTMVRAAKLMEDVCDLYLIAAYRDLELGRLLQKPVSGSDIASALGFVDTANITLESMLWRLAKHTGLVEIHKGDDSLRFSAQEDPGDPSDQLHKVRAEIESLGPDYRASLEFVEFGAAHFVEALRDDPDLLDRILSGREPQYAELWDRATNADPLQDVHGLMGAQAISSMFDGGRVLEIGGGTGNGMRHLFRHLDEGEKLDCIESYAFTDISMQFIMSTRRAMKAEYPAVQTDWQFLDINKPFAEQRVPAESVDLIYGVNAAHVAKDIVGFLEECRIALRPNGQIMFAERLRLDPMMMAHRELALNLSIYHRTAAVRNSDYRPTHCYLASDSWLQVLDRAGFKEARICPDMDVMRETFPNAYAAVVVARKS